MAPPKINWQISIGNIVQIGVFLVAAGLGWATLSAQVNSNTVAINDARAVRADLETRMRSVENTSVRADERLSSIYALLSRIDARLERIEAGR